MPSGIIVIDKPQGWTASDRVLGERALAGASALIRADRSSFSRRARAAGPHRETEEG